MTDKFISAWCEEHNFDDKLGVVLKIQDIQEADLNEFDFDQDDNWVKTPKGEYEVYDWNYIDNEIEEAYREREESIRWEYSKHPVFDYVNWDRFNRDNPFDESDILDLDEFTEVDFYNQSYFVKSLQ